ncbi:MAG: type II secretion system protein N [Limnohabitans sp.]
MSPTHNLEPGRASGRAAAWLAFLLWLAAGASLVVWALHWWAGGRDRTDAPLAAPAPASVPIAPPAWRVLSAPSASVKPDTQRPESGWQLLGVVASSAGRGSALLAQTGHPARTWRVGQSLDGRWRLVKVATGRAWLAPVQAVEGEPALLELSLPEDKPEPAAAPIPSAPASS